MYGEAIRTNMFLVSDNMVAADAVSTRIMGFCPEEVKHVVVAEKARLGSTKLEDIELNQDWQAYRRQFRIKRTLIDRLARIPDSNRMVAKLMFESPLRPLIYKIVRVVRTPQEKAIALQLEKKKKVHAR
jgi:hypothetical protein